MSVPPVHAGIFMPEDLVVMRNVYDRVVGEPWTTADAFAHEDYARFIVGAYGHSQRDPERLFRLCLVAANLRLAGPPSSGNEQETRKMAADLRSREASRDAVNGRPEQGSKSETLKG